MSKERIALIIEDEEDISELLKVTLQGIGLSPKQFQSGEDGLQAALKISAHSKLEMILLDLMLPGLDGLEVCKRLKTHEQTAKIPIVMVSAKGEESDVVRGLELGADDYLTKPFSPKILQARVKSVLRRISTAVKSIDDVLEVDAVKIHPGRHEVTVEGAKLDLTPSEFQILHLLARRPGWVFTRGQIVDGIRGENYAVTERSIDVQVVGLRKKLGAHEGVIETVRGVGYRFKDSD